MLAVCFQGLYRAKGARDRDRDRARAKANKGLGQHILPHACMSTCMHVHAVGHMGELREPCWPEEELNWEV